MNEKKDVHFRDYKEHRSLSISLLCLVLISHSSYLPVFLKGMLLCVMLVLVVRLNTLFKKALNHQRSTGVSSSEEYM